MGPDEWEAEPRYSNRVMIGLVHMPKGTCRLGESPLGAADDSAYELCTSAGFSGPIRHSRLLQTLQVTDSSQVKVIMVLAHAGEPPFVSKTLCVSVYELCTDGDLTSRRTVRLFCVYLRSKPDSAFVEP